MTPARYTLRYVGRKDEPAANYDFEILEGDRVVARYWFDFRHDDHGVTFKDGRDHWLKLPATGFVHGGPDRWVFTPTAIAWLERELGRELRTDDHLRDRGGILAALSAAESEVAGFFSLLTAGELGQRVGTAWTAVEQLDHLDTSVEAVARGFAMPKLLLRLRFGRAPRPGRAYTRLRDAYRDRLAAGGRAPAAFVPTVMDPAGAAVETRRDDLLARWRRHNGRLRAAVATWSERRLDTIALPHPILGTITAREMLYFTIYHAEHHLAAARRRLPRFAEDA